MEVSQHPMYFHCCTTSSSHQNHGIRKRKVIDTATEISRASKIRCISTAADQQYTPSSTSNLVTPSSHIITQSPSLHHAALPSSVNPPLPSDNHEMMEYSSSTPVSSVVPTAANTCPQCLGGESGHLMHILQQQQRYA